MLQFRNLLLLRIWKLGAITLGKTFQTVAKILSFIVAGCLGEAADGNAPNSKDTTSMRFMAASKVLVFKHALAGVVRVSPF